MIITKELKIRANSSKIEYYRNLGYDVLKNKDFVINIKDLSLYSSYKISVRCDYCGKEKEISYSRYNINTDEGKRKYACSSICSREKAKETCVNKYNVENPSQLEEIKNKKKDTCFNNHGVESPAQSNIIKEKMKQTCIDKYGVENPMFSEDIKNKLFDTNLEKYGYKCSLSNEDVKKKREKTWEENYGGHPLKSERIREKIYYTMVENGYRVFDSGYTYYKKIVDSITNQIKNDFIKSWNGVDFYDGDYIKENYDLDSNDKDYPTIDHKISIMNGFNNKIPPDIIGGIDNLCMTKRRINSQKGSKNSDNFQL